MLARGCCSPALTIPQPHGHCMEPRRGVIFPHRIMLAENGVAPWVEVETMCSPGTEYEHKPLLLLQGNSPSRSVTQVLVLLREVVLVEWNGGKGRKAVRDGSPHAYV